MTSSYYGDNIVVVLRNIYIFKLNFCWKNGGKEQKRKDVSNNLNESNNNEINICCETSINILSHKIYYFVWKFWKENCNE